MNGKEKQNNIPPLTLADEEAPLLQQEKEQAQEINIEGLSLVADDSPAAQEARRKEEEARRGSTRPKASEASLERMYNEGYKENDFVKYKRRSRTPIYIALIALLVIALLYFD